jgi:putative cardiolipin synthase
VSAEFDEYWNSEVVYPLPQLLGSHRSSDSDLVEVRHRLEQRMQVLRGTRYASALSSTDLARSIEKHDLNIYWGGCTLVADQPAKVILPPEDTSTHAMPQLRERLGQVREELVLVSPYFVPGKWGTRWLQGLAGRGVTVKVLTNSIEAMDAPGVMAAYSAYRKELLRSGVQLYELKPSLETALVQPEHESKASKSSLHAKSYMADAQTIYVGSMNLDPRSVALNTEMGLIIDSASLGARMREGFLARLPEIAYRVELDTSTDPKGRLVWTTQEGSQEKRYDDEPGKSSWDGFMQLLQRALPIEKQL